LITAQTYLIDLTKILAYSIYYPDQNWIILTKAAENLYLSVKLNSINSMKIKSFLLLLLLVSFRNLQGQNRWHNEADGSISWTIKPGEAHTDNIEMSGKFISVIATYGTDEAGKPVTRKQLVFPMLRTIPNDTHASLSYTFLSESQPLIKVNGRQAFEEIKSFSIRGILYSYGTINKNLKTTRTLFPSVDKPLVIEKCVIENLSYEDIKVDIEDFEKISRSHIENSFYGIYEVSAKCYGAGIYLLKPNENLTFNILYSGKKVSDPDEIADADTEYGKREEFVNLMFNTLSFSCPDSAITRMFDFAKIRAMESIFQTKGGLVHSPGGGAYYAAIWANDQAEYANPFFAYTGYPVAITAGMNSWRWFMKYMNPEYKPIPSSIIAEGTGYWNGAGDRGDQAMIAYGASRFALALGDRKSAEELWPLIEWCIEYCRKKINSEGVITSDSDELEGRFPSGDANLCTSSLFYDALNSAVYLGHDLGKSPVLINRYRNLAVELKNNIEKYFGARIDGYDTYRYFKGNDTLRSWICIPLTVGIFTRSNGTLNALFSKELWTDQGLLTQAGSATFWDRSTLYGLRGALFAGATEKGIHYLSYYSTHRLLGDHVPYAVEAWPEGNQRHLSAESALYCRVITEGLFGFRPTGLNSFSITPRLPGEWNEMSMKNIVAFGSKKIDINVERKKKKNSVTISSNGKVIMHILVNEGIKIAIKLPE